MKLVGDYSKNANEMQDVLHFRESSVNVIDVMAVFYKEPIPEEYARNNPGVELMTPIGDKSFDYNGKTCRSRMIYGESPAIVYPEDVEDSREVRLPHDCYECDFGIMEDLGTEADVKRSGLEVPIGETVLICVCNGICRTQQGFEENYESGEARPGWCPLHESHGEPVLVNPEQPQSDPLALLTDER